MSLVVLIPDGVGVRNFVLGKFLDEASRRIDTTILHAVPEALLPTYASDVSKRVTWRRLLPYRETPLSFTLRYSLGYAQLYWGNTASMRIHLSRGIHGSRKTKAAHRLAKLTGRLASSPRGIQALERWHCSTVGRMSVLREYVRLYQEIRPTILFCTHQRPPVILPAVLAARLLGIPTVTFIFSWDNLTSKGRIAAPFDHYFVWSDLMRRELLQFYPDVSADRIHLVGTPQFEPYADSGLLWSREEFFRRVGADPTRRLICYSGNDTMNCPMDQDLVRVLMTLIRSGRIEGSPQVLLRPAPVDDGKRYDEMRRDFPELIYQPPAWLHTRPGSWDYVLPSAEDVQFLANLTHHSDMNVNFGSTMALDFALRDKPVVIAAFDVSDPLPHGMPSYDYCMHFDHYRPVETLGAARFARSVASFAEYINAYLANPALDREGRRSLVDTEVGAPIGQSNTRIVQALLQIAGTEQSTQHRRAS